MIRFTEGCNMQTNPQINWKIYYCVSSTASGQSDECLIQQIEIIVVQMAHHTRYSRAPYL